MSIEDVFNKLWEYAVHTSGTCAVVDKVDLRALLDAYRVATTELGDIEAQLLVDLESAQIERDAARAEVKALKTEHALLMKHYMSLANRYAS